MKFMTKEYVNQEAKKGDLAALRCSLLHHQQGRDATRGQLIDGIENNAFALGIVTCACCEKYRFPSCEGCPLGHHKSCCKGLYELANVALELFDEDPTLDNHQAFKDAEQAVCDYIQGVIDGLEKNKEKQIAEEKKPKLRHGDYGFSDRQDTTHLVIADNTGALRWTNFTGGYDGERVKKGDHARHFVRIGNIFDGLTVLSKPLTEFEMNGKGYKLEVIAGEDNVRFTVNAGNSNLSTFIPLENFDELILNLRRIQATLKK